MRFLFLPLLLLFFSPKSFAASDDSLRGSNGPYRKGWDVLRYEMNMDIDPSAKSISGYNGIVFRAIEDSVRKLQIDLQQPMELQEVYLHRIGRSEDGEMCIFSREGNVYWVNLPQPLNKGEEYILGCRFSGTPREAKNPPWDGGFVWKKDKSGKPWVAVACQGDGASLWFPCKDFQADEPDSGAAILINNRQVLPVISNGKRYSKRFLDNNPQWQVKSSINPYNITFYLGDYVGWTDTFNGLNGKLPLSFYCLRGNEAKARKQFAVVPQMLRCYEEKVGPYPFYQDGYKLVEAPYLGMEHQSAIAYGNGYQMGYLGRDRSKTGVGKTFDYIIIHESGHEWFGNSITAADVADNWIHEGFTTYLESVFVECSLGKEKALKYLYGERQNIENDRPIIGRYGVCDDGSGDKYDKGAVIIGMLRAMHLDDSLFWRNFREMYRRFAHSTVTSAQVEAFWSEALGRDLKPFFNQYLRSIAIPRLEIRKMAGLRIARLIGVEQGLSLPLFFSASGMPIEVGVTWMPIGRQHKPRKEFLVRE